MKSCGNKEGFREQIITIFVRRFANVINHNLMKKGILFLLGVIFICVSVPASAQLQEHIDEGRKVYNQNANKEQHQIVKSSKEISEYIVGDTRSFWRYNLSVMPPSWINQAATCRAVGEHSYVFVADADWGTKMTQEDVDIIINYLENITAASTEMGIVEMNQTYFGEIPDELDADPKVIFYYSSLGSYNGSVFDGYFSPFNQMTESEAQMSGEHSNECEMLYMSCYPVEPTSLGTLSVLAHELEHLIHFGHDSNEESWVDEGCAEYAMVLFGQPDPISSFNTNSDNNLSAWDQQYSDYVKTMLFFTYLSEQTTGPGFITSLVANSLNGISGIESEFSLIMFPLDFQQIFTNWTLANYIDDETFESGVYSYEILDLPAFTHKQYFTSYPAVKTTTLKDLAAHYYRFSVDFTTLDLSFQFPQGGEWDLNLITFEDDMAKEIIPISEDNILFNYPETYILSKLVLVVTNKEIGTATKTYTLNGNNMTGINEFSKENYVSVYPNPAKDFVTISLENCDFTNVNVKVFNVFGQEVQNYPAALSTIENSNFKMNTSGFAEGIYFLNIETKNEVVIEKLIIE
jgi:hypothetical protein